MKQILSILILVTFFSCKNENTESNLSSIFIDVSSNIVNPKTYIITKAKEKIIIDGKADDSDWQSAIFTDYFIDIEGVKQPKYNTKLKMLWDEKYLYIYSQLQEPHVWGDLKKRDTVIFYNNDFEVFIDPSGTTRNYCEIEINALGTVWDLVMDKPYRVGGKAKTRWDINELLSAVHIDGTLNNQNDTDSLWSVEIAIPIISLLNLKTYPSFIPEEGEQWRINFSRVQWEHDIVNGKYRRKKENGEFLKEHNWVWSQQKVINMHEPEKWGILQFTNKSSLKDIVYKEDKDMHVKQIAYALFRQTNYGSLKELLKKNVCSTENIKIKYSEKDTTNALFYKTNHGFEFKIENPVTNNTFIINEQGILNLKSD